MSHIIWLANTNTLALNCTKNQIIHNQHPLLGQTFAFLEISARIVRVSFMKFLGVTIRWDVKMTHHNVAYLTFAFCPKSVFDLKTLHTQGHTGPTLWACCCRVTNIFKLPYPTWPPWPMPTIYVLNPSKMHELLRSHKGPHMVFSTTPPAGGPWTPMILCTPPNHSFQMNPHWGGGVDTPHRGSVGMLVQHTPPPEGVHFECFPPSKNRL